MGRYTHFLEERSYELFSEDKDYKEELLENAKLFRRFDEAMDAFLVSRGTIGERETVEKKILFLNHTFKEAGIKPPRNMRKWFTEYKRIERKTAFQICFAFSLDVEESDDFFRKVCLQRGFDLHSVWDIVCFFSLSHGYRYEEAVSLYEDIQKRNNGDSGVLSMKKAGVALKNENEKKKSTQTKTIYTSVITEEIQKIQNPEELKQFFERNIEMFGYRNVTAYRYIQNVWKEIAGEAGLAEKERKRLYRPFVLGENEKLSGQEKRDSLWKIYLQILGLSGDQISVLKTDRSLKPILRDNPMLHPLAEFSFPDRDGLNKILNGELVSYERVRKILILLVFYKYWVSLALERGHYDSTGGDLPRCERVLNTYLLDAGYPLLYIGNPFDWTILYSLVNSEFPLLSFREFMQELFYEKYSAT